MSGPQKDPPYIGPPPDPRRGSRADARGAPIDPGLLARVAAGLKSLFTSYAGQSPPPEQAPATGPAWMGPGSPLEAMAPPQDVAGRAFDYPVAYNVGARPRRNEGVTFEELRALADGLDMVRLAIETRKDQMGNLAWSCLPRQKANDDLRQKPDERCAKIEDFMRLPDGRNSFHSWLRLLVEEQLVTDAPSIYVRRTLGGDVYSLDVVDGSTISPLLDKTGRTPLVPDIAYQQILKGLPAIDYTTEELIYWPRNRRPGRIYGMSPVQQIIMTVNIAIRREIEKLNYFTEGNIPPALVSVPKSWTPEQIDRFQAMWDALLADQTKRRRMHFVPGEMQYQPTINETMLGDASDEWLARVICYAFSLPPLPFVRMMNRATAQSAQEAALEEGLQPMMNWFKSLLDHVIQKVFGYDDLELVWDDIRKVDPAEQEQRDLAMIQLGRLSVDESRARQGLPPVGLSEPFIMGIGPMQIMFVSDLLKAQKQGLLMPQAGVPPDATAGGMIGHNGGPPMLPGGTANLHAGAAATLQRVPPKLLGAVGMGAAGASGRLIDVTEADQAASDPLSNVVAHPAVLRTLRAAERTQGRGRR